MTDSSRLVYYLSRPPSSSRQLLLQRLFPLPAIQLCRSHHLRRFLSPLARSTPRVLALWILALWILALRILALQTLAHWTLLRGRFQPVMAGARDLLHA